MTDEWMWNPPSANNVWTGNRFATREAAIAAGRVECEGSFDVGRVTPYSPNPPDGNDIVDTLACRAEDECGEAAEWWLQDVTKVQQAELTEAVYAVVMAWLEKHALTPDFWTMTDVEVVRPEATSEPMKGE